MFNFFRREQPKTFFEKVKDGATELLQDIGLIEKEKPKSYLEEAKESVNNFINSCISFAGKHPIATSATIALTSSIMIYYSYLYFYGEDDNIAFDCEDFKNTTDNIQEICRQSFSSNTNRLIRSGNTWLKILDDFSTHGSKFSFQSNEMNSAAALYENKSPAIKSYNFDDNWNVFSIFGKQNVNKAIWDLQRSDFIEVCDIPDEVVNCIKTM